MGRAKNFPPCLCKIFLPMSQLLLVHRRSPLGSMRFRNTIPLQVRAGKFFLMFSMVMLGGLMSFLYLMNYSDIQTKGYQLRKLEMERQELRTQHEIKMMNVSKVRSLGHIQKSAQLARMVPLRNPIYLNADSKLARTE